MIHPRPGRIATGSLATACRKQCEGAEWSKGSGASLPGKDLRKDEGYSSVNGAAYVGHVLDCIETMWFRADTVDWSEFRHRHLALAARSPSQAEVHNIVDGILADLNDGHSHLVRPSAGTAASPRQPPSMVGELRDSVGYIEVPWFVGNPEFSAEEFAGRIQRTIADLERARPYGWMVDLRRNAGGNMWPMLAGLGPLLGSGLIGSFIAQGRIIPWSYENGAACNGGRVLCRAPGQSHVMDEPIGRTAILIGPRTASAGEAVCIAFKGRPGTRFFGDPTAGSRRETKPCRWKTAPCWPLPPRSWWIGSGNPMAVA